MAQSPSKKQVDTRNIWSTDSQGRYAYTIKVNEYAEVGKWQIIITLVDNVGNAGTHFTDKCYEVINPNEDTIPPTLEKLEVSKERVNAGEEVTIYVTANDEHSGVQYVSIMAQSPTKKQVETRNIWSKDVQGRYAYTIKVKDYAEVGKWQIIITLVDNVGNSESYLTGKCFEVINPNPDTTPPTLEKLAVSKDRVNAGEEVTIYVTANDEHSGVQYVSIMAQSPSKKQVETRNIWNKDSQGRYSYTIKVNEYAELGKWQIIITLVDNVGNSESHFTERGYEVITPNLDTTPPAKPLVNEVTDQSTSVTGTAEAGSTVRVRVGSTVLGTAVADSTGSFSVVIVNQVAGTKLLVTAADAAGNVSEVLEVTVKDVTAPGAPKVNEVTDQSTSVTGTAESGSTVTVKRGSSVLGKAVSNSDGTFSIAISLQKAEVKLTVTATDSSGNTSKGRTVTVLDVTPPSIPTVKRVTDKSTTVTGNAEPGSTVTVKRGTRVLGNAIAKNDGTFTITILVQKADAKLTVTATDKAGNVSKARSVTVKDVTPPPTPTVNTVTDKATRVTGKAEAGSTVTVKRGSSVLGNAVAKSDGTFSISITKQKAEAKLVITATDKAGNVSKARNITVKDVTPPSIPTANTITSKTVSVTGKAEKGATIYIFNGTTKVGQGVVDSKGTFKVSMKAQKKGATLKIHAEDNAKNKSKSISVVVK